MISSQIKERKKKDLSSYSFWNWRVGAKDQDQDSLLVKRRNDNHSPANKDIFKDHLLCMESIDVGKFGDLHIL